MKMLLSVCLIGLIQGLVFSQTTNPNPNPNPTPPRPTTRIDAQTQRQIDNERRKQQRDIPLEEIRKVTDIPIPQTATPISSIIRSNRSAEQLEKLLPDSQDLEKYSTFVKSKKAGIFKLFPDFDCDSRNAVNVGNNCLNNIPFSWSYSFLRKDYGDGDFFDLRFKNERIVVDGFLTQNILTALGDIPLEEVSLQTKGVKFLTEYKPKNIDRDLQKQFWQLANRISADGFNYGKVVTPKENITYLIRIIAYRISYADIAAIEKNGARSDYEKRLLFISYDRSRRDKIIAFRVIKKNLDGSLTILWNELADKKSPALEFSSREASKDTAGKRN